MDSQPNFLDNNSETPESKNLSWFRKHLLVNILLLITLVVGLYQGINSYKEYKERKLQERYEKSLTEYTKKKESGYFDQTANWKIYRNEKYGFELTLNNMWEDYKTTTEFDSLPQYGDVRIKFYLLTKDSSYKSNLTGYAVVFAIVVMDKESWSHIPEGPRAIYLGEKGKYVFAYDNGYENVPIDLDLQQSQVDQILSTFKFIELDPAKVILRNVIATNLRIGNIEAALKGFSSNEEERAISNREILLKSSEDDLESFAYYFENAEFVEEFGQIRVYRGPLKELDGSMREVTFMMSKSTDGVWRVISW